MKCLVKWKIIGCEHGGFGYCRTKGRGGSKILQKAGRDGTELLLFLKSIMPSFCAPDLRVCGVSAYTCFELRPFSCRH
jgi:hypothetical protein